MRGVWVLACLLVASCGEKTETRNSRPRSASDGSNAAPDNPRADVLQRPEDESGGSDFGGGAVDDSTTSGPRRDTGEQQGRADDASGRQPHEVIFAMIDAAAAQDRAALARLFHPDCDAEYRAIRDGSASNMRVAEVMTFLTGIKVEEARVQGDGAVVPYMGSGSMEFRLKRDADGQWKVMGW